MAQKNRKQKSGFVAFIGRPNAGKSTLLNRLVGEKIAIVSDKPQTTRTRIRGILTKPEGQVVFLDTPGIHKPGYKLNRRMMTVVADALLSVDLLLLMVDATQAKGAGDKFVLDMLRHVEKPVFLLLNKIDKIADKSRLLSLIKSYTAEREFAEVIPLSALKKDNVDLLLEKIFAYLPEGEPFYEADDLTDQPERVLVAELVREKILQVTKEELPYVTAVVTERWEETDESLKIYCLIYVEKASHKSIIIGRGGERLKEIGTAARQEIEKFLGRKIFLGLHVKVREHWRDDERVLDELGIQE
ncbi:MAG: GTPase Era [Acidobacteriota bacterium]